MKQNIIVALDGISQQEALKIAKSLKRLVWGFKVNDLLFDSISVIKKLNKYGRVFADAKLHDIPNTVANSVVLLSAAGADMITVHASGGIEMMRAAKKSVGTSKIIAVTVLTSDSDSSDLGKRTLKLASDAIRAGVDGIVCSAQELKYLNRIKLLKIVPGIRPAWYNQQDDQKRTATPHQAIKDGADFLVIGRPIISSKDPIKTVKNILAE